MTTTPPIAGAPDVVRLHDVAKRFVLRKDNSLKERLVTLGRLGRKHREEFWALRGIELTIPAGSTIGLIGHNGSGKSTLLKVIGGIIGPTSGTVESRGRIAALLELGAGFHPDLTGRENVYLNASILGMSRKETDARFAEILAFAGIGEFIDTQVKFYSSGMYVRLAFAVAVHTDPDILLVDEVLSVGDEAFQRKCLDTIRRFQQEGRTIVLVSHSLGQIQEFCDRTVLLDHGDVAFDGDPSEAVRLFRSLLEDRRIAEDSGPDPAPGQQSPRVMSTRVTDTDGAEREFFEPGEAIALTVTVESDEPITDWLVGIQIDTSMGQPLYNTATSELGYRHEVLEGSRTVSFIISESNLGAGRYFVNVSLQDSMQHLHDVPQALSFEVRASGRSGWTGPVWMRSRVE